MENIVSTNVSYNSNILEQNLRLLQRKYTFLNVQEIGLSILGTSLHVIKLGIGKKQVFYCASIHANEWITSVVLMKFLEDFCIAYTFNTTIYGYNAREIFQNTSIYIAPMINPDGVNLVTSLYKNGSLPYEQARKIAINYPNIPFPSGWKANIKRN